MTKECIKTACPYCGVGCGVEVNKQRISGDEKHPANSGALCVKGSALAESLQMPSRLLYPKLNCQEISWDQATDIIAESYFNAINATGADSTAMYVSGQLLTEDYYVANKFMKGLVGSANIDTNSRLCMSSAVVAHNRAFGEDIVPVNYSDIDDAELIVICGANTAWTHPVLFRRIQQAREQNPRLKLVVIDPRVTVTAEQADLHLQIPNDSDIDLFNGLVRYCVDRGLVNQEYIDEHTLGFEALLSVVAKSEYSLTKLSHKLDLNEDQLAVFYRWFSTSKRAITLFCQGVNQSQYGSDKANTIINAHLATGKIGYRGAGPFSITGQPNAMGGREVGGLANQLAIHRGFDADSIERVSQFWKTNRLATKPGLKAVELFEAVERGDIKVIWIMATNPVVSMPDNHYVKEALMRCPMVIVSDITGDSDIARYANLLLPAAGWGEKQGMVTNSERMLTRQRAFMSPKGGAKPDWKAVAEVAKKLSEKLNVESGFEFQNEYEVFKEYVEMTGLNQDSPLLLDLSNFSNLTLQEYADWQPTRWGRERPYEDGTFSHSDGKARFVVPSDVTLTETASRDNSWWLNTGRQRDQWHTMTRTGHIAHLAASEPEPSVYMNRRSAAYLGVDVGELVMLTKDQAITQGEDKLFAKVLMDDGLTDKQLFMSMHWAGKYGSKSSVNGVVSRNNDPFSGQPAFKSQAVEVMPARAKSYGLYISDTSAGESFDEQGLLYASLQKDHSLSVWRFADSSLTEKSFSLSLGSTSGSGSVVLDLSSGWLSVTYDQVGSDKRIESLMLVSSQPIHCDTAQLIELIGQPLTFSSLLSIVDQESSSKLICSCFRVSDTQIEKVLKSGECSTTSHLQKKLKCGSNCGSCLPQIDQLVSQFSPSAQIESN